MIFHPFKCIFVHQRKAAGGSIIKSFGFKSLEEPDRHFLNDGVRSKSSHLEDWKRLYDDYFVFAVVRNPWDRFVSGWKYLESTKTRSLLEVLRDLPKKGHDYRHLTRLQSDTLFDSKGQLITDFLIRFESLQEGFDSVCDQIGRPRIILPHTKQTSRDHYKSYFQSSESIRLFEKHFGKDIRAFGYNFDDE